VPAKTTNQLYQTHGQYLDAAESGEEAFNLALNEIMPRIYKMGYWREMLVEHTQDASDGYVSLPQDTDSIVAGILDDNPLPTRSLWHDYKLFGTNSQNDTLVNAFIDDGYAPTYRDLVSGSQYKVSIASLKANFSLIPKTGSITIRYRHNADSTDGADALVGGVTPLEGVSYNEMVFTMTESSSGPTNIILQDSSPFNALTDVTQIISISWEGLPPDHPVRLIAKYQGDVGANPVVTDTTKDLKLVDLDTSRGSSRYRRFRVGGTNSNSSAHMLLKRKWVDVDSNTDLVHMPANAILKHALLGKLAEDNADIQRASYHWGLVAQLLEADTDSYRGAAKPTLKVAPDGVGAGMSGMY